MLVGGRDRAIVAAVGGTEAFPDSMHAAGEQARADVLGNCGLTRSKHSGDDVETPSLHCVCDGENRPKWLAYLALFDVEVTGQSAGAQRQLGEA